MIQDILKREIKEKERREKRKNILIKQGAREELLKND